MWPPKNGDLGLMKTAYRKKSVSTKMDEESKPPFVRSMCRHFMNGFCKFGTLKFLDNSNSLMTIDLNTILQGTLVISLIDVPSSGSTLKRMLFAVHQSFETSEFVIRHAGIL